MMNRWMGTCFGLFAAFTIGNAFALDNVQGQVIQINTDLCSLRGEPSWLLIIRDVDRGVNIPYLYDFRQPQNFWLALTQSSNYLIVASRMKFHVYNVRENTFHQYVINDFCKLESRGRIIHGDSYSIRITGDLRPYPDTLLCNVSRYPDPMALQGLGATS